MIYMAPNGINTHIQEISIIARSIREESRGAITMRDAIAMARAIVAKGGR